MGRITRYLAAVGLVRSVACLGLLVAVFAAIDIVEATAWIDAPRLSVLPFYLFKLPLIATYLLPLALLLGVLLAVASLFKRGEWDLLQACGISPVRLLLGIFATPVAGALVCFALVMWLAPYGVGIWHSVAYRGEHGQSESIRWTRSDGRLIRRRSDGSTVFIERGAGGEPWPWVFLSPTEKEGTVVWRAGGGWQTEPVALDATAAWGPDPGPPGLGRISHPGELPGSSMSVGELARAAEELRELGVDPAAVRAELGLRAALVLACLVLPMMGMGLCLGRLTAGAAALLARGLVAAFAFWLCLAVAWNGATAGLWPVAWIWAGVPLSFGAVSLFWGYAAWKRLCGNRPLHA